MPSPFPEPAVPAFLRLSMLLLALSFGSAAQADAGTSWLSAKWLPMSAENERAYREAAARYAAAAREAAQSRKNNGDKTPTGGGVVVGTGIGSAGNSSMGYMGVPGMNPDEAARRARRKAGEPEDDSFSLDRVLPPTLDFAAPKGEGLILQRTSSSMLFARAGKQDVVFVPLFGQADLPHGARASVREDADRVQLTVVLASGPKVEFGYRRQAPAADAVLAVDVRISDIPGGTLEFTRLYRRAPGP
jgi:hypothetical protein